MADKVTGARNTPVEDTDPVADAPKAPQTAPAPAPQMDITRAVTEAVVAAQLARITPQGMTPNMDVASREGGMFIEPGGRVVDAFGNEVPDNEVPADVRQQARSVVGKPAPATHEGE